MDTLITAARRCQVAGKAWNAIQAKCTDCDEGDWCGVDEHRQTYAALVSARGALYLAAMKLEDE